MIEFIFDKSQIIVFLLIISGAIKLIFTILVYNKTDVTIDKKQNETTNIFRILDRGDIKPRLTVLTMLYSSFKSGLFGFGIFITVLILVKLVSYLLGSYPTFEIEVSDLLLSLVGFALLFIIRFLENFKEETEDTGKKVVKNTK